VFLPAPDVARDAAVGQHGLRDVGVIWKDLSPARRERVALAWRERRHLVRLGLALMLEEDRQVVRDHIP
jgi:hypothetical protein